MIADPFGANLDELDCFTAKPSWVRRRTTHCGLLPLRDPQNQVRVSAVNSTFRTVRVGALEFLKGAIPIGTSASVR